MKKLFLFSIILFFSCNEEKMVILHKTGISDYKYFANREIQASPTPYNYYNSEFKCYYKIDSINRQYNSMLQTTGTVAFIVIKNDTVMYEKYYDGYERSSIVPSFSMAKAFTSALIGCAIEDHLIQSVNQPMKDFIPGLDKKFSGVTVKHLLQMTSGIKFSMYDNPFMEDAQLYYATNLRKVIRHMKLEYTPGTHFKYDCGNTLLLGAILEKVLRGKTVSSYLQEKIWNPLQMEYNASWSVDNKKSGLEKTFCCINGRAIDYAKFGELYLKKGNWCGNQVLSPDWVAQSLTPDTTDGGICSYKYQWRLLDNKAFAAAGLYGQYIYVNPDKNTIIVRLGKRKKSNEWIHFFNSISENV